MSHWTDHRKDSNVTAMYVHIQWTTVINSTRNHTWNNWRCGAMSVRVPVCMLVRRSWCPRWSQVGPSVRGLDKRWGAMVTFKLATLALSPTLLGPFVTWSDLAETSSTTHQIEILRTAHGYWLGERSTRKVQKVNQDHTETSWQPAFALNESGSGEQVVRWSDKCSLNWNPARNSVCRQKIMRPWRTWTDTSVSTVSCFLHRFVFASEIQNNRQNFVFILRFLDLLKLT